MVQVNRIYLIFNPVHFLVDSSVRHSIERRVLTDTNKELLDFVKTVLNIADFLLQFWITRIREFVILEQLFLDEETALDTV